MTCEEQILSNDYFDFIINTELAGARIPEGACIQRVSSEYSVLFYPSEGLPPLNIADYIYSVIPKCFTLLDQTALEVSGISRVQNQPTLSLTGQGVLVGIMDTGIAYENPIFRYSDGSTRVEAIWDQNIPGNPPEGFLYGTEYTREDIDEALMLDDPYERVPSRDEEGHGTFLAGVAAGDADYANDFIGAAPGASIAVVKLKPAKQYLRDFFFIPEDAMAYQETDLMTAAAYLSGLADRLGMPLVLCVAVGTNMGSHSGKSPFSDFLSDLGRRARKVIVTSAGNEANARHHYFGRIEEETKQDMAEINVEENVRGFAAELWVSAPELYTIALTSPSGEQVPRMISQGRPHSEYQFIFERTVVSIDYRNIGRESGNQLIYIRFDRPTRGIWTLQVYGINYLGGNYHIWLPMREMLSGDVFFIRSSPDTTITVPANAQVPITVGGYNAKDGSLYIGSSRGYTVDGRVKPDFAAPGVNVYGPTLRGEYTYRTGTSAAAAVCAGACALFLQWAAVIGDYGGVNTVDTKNFLIRGARRELERAYPNREWGYGKLDLYNAFDILRER